MQGQAFSLIGIWHGGCIVVSMKTDNAQTRIAAAGMIKIFLSALFLLLPAFAHAAALGDLRISLLEGDVLINTGDAGDWVAASINVPLKPGDRIWVPEGGTAELQLKDGTCIRLGGNTSLDLTAALDSDSIGYSLNAGRAYVNFRGSGDNPLQVDTPISTLQAYDKAVFRIDVAGDTAMSVSVLRGLLYDDRRGIRTTVRSGEMLAASEFSSDLRPSGPPDDWERWNRGRDRLLYERTYNSRYLPGELAPYSSDFDRYGKWVYTREYGYCWTPSSVASPEWAPYRIGRWVWMRGDYVWVSYEPWGWVPYHFGRWVYSSARGWFWVPPTREMLFWGPGFVGWVHTSSYVAWVPLAPGDIYYGYGYYGPNSVNIAINKTIVKNVVSYKNASSNAVTVMSTRTFATGRPIKVLLKDNPFLKEGHGIGRPEVRMVKNAAMPVVREIPPAKRPPSFITERKVRTARKTLQLPASVQSPKPGSPAGREPDRTGSSMSQGRPFVRQELQKGPGYPEDLRRQRPESEKKITNGGRERQQANRNKEPKKPKLAASLPTVPLSILRQFLCGSRSCSRQPGGRLRQPP